ncbi:hypothetical protein WJU16_22145 [Chitinophaga pollutisoli]|uniref:OMP85-like membrane spanning beta-barrel domain-containing protein n=1 Tax=Chitinophaga pollutisoli TaxID=3133966 RepID=A0ABZ2YMD2_9BACT
MSGSLQFMLNRVMAVGIGSRWEYIRVKPKLSPNIQIDGNTNQLNSYVFFGLNTLDRQQFPTRGATINLEAGAVHSQHPDMFVRLNGHDLRLDSIGFRFNNYTRLSFKSNYYVSLGRKSSLMMGAYAGFNFNYNQLLVNDFRIGGVTDFSRGQIPFVGLYDGEVSTASVGALQLGWQYEALRNIFAIPRVSAAVYDLIGNLETNYRYVTGYGLTLAYSTKLGPMEATLMYSDQAQILKAYVNLGFHF